MPLSPKSSPKPIPKTPKSKKSVDGDSEAEAHSIHLVVPKESKGLLGSFKGAEQFLRALSPRFPRKRVNPAAKDKPGFHRKRNSSSINENRKPETPAPLVGC